MKIEELDIPGVLLGRPDRFEDDRGWFMEILREDVFGMGFVQANHSHSRAGVLRGLHFHTKQSDAWYVVRGETRVGLADIRTRTEHPAATTVEMSGADPKVLYIPPGVAHGFYAVTEMDLIYWVTHYFDNSDEHGIKWDDPTARVPWRVEEPILSERDSSALPVDWDQVKAVLSTR